MREKLQTLPLVQIRELAKAQGIKGVTALKKAELIDRLCEKAGEISAEKPAEKKTSKTNKKSSGGEGENPSGTPAERKEEKGAQRAETGVSGQTGADSSQPPRQEQARGESVRQEQGRVDSSRQEQGRPDSLRQEERYVQPQRTYVRNDYRSDYRGNQNYRNNGSSYRNGGSSGRSYQNNGSYQRNNYSDRSDYRTGAGSSGSSYGNNGNNGGSAGNGGSSAGALNGAGDARNFQSFSSQEGQGSFRSDVQPDYRAQEGTQDGRSQDYRSQDYRDSSDEMKTDLQDLDSGIEANGILEVMPDGFGFIRCENFLPGENDVYVAPSQIRRFNLKTGDIVAGSRRIKTATEKFAALLYIKSVNGYPTSVIERRPNFESLTPIFPDERLHMEMPGMRNSTAMRVLDLLSPIGKGQRGMIVSPPKAGKTTLLKQVAKAVTTNHPDMHLIILLIDERPEEVTDIREAITGPNVEVIYSTFDELPERHKRVSEMVIERAKRLVEHGRDVMILLDSMTRLARAYNLVVPASGRTLSGGLDPAALHMPKRFFGAARNIREGGSLTILATALIDTGSRMDDVIYEEFKGTGNMELVLDRKLSEKRIFPAIDILKSGTRRDDLLLNPLEAEAVDIIHKATNTLKPEESVERILDLFARTKNNREFVDMVKKVRI